jgi:hypothetical protein
MARLRIRYSNKGIVNISGLMGQSNNEAGFLRETPGFVKLHLFEIKLKPSMEISFLPLSSHGLEEWAFQNGAHRLLP